MHKNLNNYPRIVIAGTSSGTGKTTLTLGLLYALKKRGIDVQPYKCGPDYIDSGLHSRVSGKSCRNLDSFLLTRDVILELFERKSAEASFSLIEGVMGLFDGVGGDSDEGTTAHVAKILSAPVILVIDAGKMAGSAGAMALGYKEFDDRLNMTGCILNGIASESHYRTAKQAIEGRAGVSVLGYLKKDKSLFLPERHLGLLPASELELHEYIEKLAELIEKTVDIDAVIEKAKSAGPLPSFQKSLFGEPEKKKTVTLAVASDKAFHFYYEDNLDIMKHYGVELIRFSPLKSEQIPPSADGVYIGGGFPEVFASELAKNNRLKEDLKVKSEAGMPIYAECGGLMYLMDKLVDFDGNEFPMTGIFPGIVRMGEGLRMFGYHHIESIHSNIISRKGDKIRGHIFHWSYVENMPKTAISAFKVFKEGREEKFQLDGFSKGNTLASYVHVHFGSGSSWAKRFIDSLSRYQKFKN